VLASAALWGCGGGSKSDSGLLAVGLTEFNPSLVATSAERPRVPPGFDRARDALAALRPKYLRVQVDWATVQQRPDRPPNWETYNSGCEQTASTCAPFLGVRDQLRAARSRQRAGGGYEVVVNFLRVPPWAARAPSGCESSRRDPTSSQIAPAALPAYRALLESLLALGRREGVVLRYWSAWNEPNFHLFVSPQRARCDAGSPSLAPAYYAQLVRILRATLASAPGRHDILLGEVSDYSTPGARGTSTVEFVRGLPQDVVCAGSIWAHHVYAGDANTVDEVEAALDARGCPQRHRIWITETGTRTGDPAGERAGCRRMDALLHRWYADPRVDAAFQYTFREAPQFPVGLADPTLTRLYPTYYLWRAWGGARAPQVRPPRLPAECS
jgi:hypothetical protein